MNGPPEMRSPAGQGEASKGDDLVEKAVSTTIAEIRSTRQAAWAERNPLKRWAHGATRSAIKRGLLVPLDRCEDCVVVEEQPPIAVYRNRRNHLIIRSQGNGYDDEDSFVHVGTPQSLKLLIAALQRELKEWRP